MKIVRRILIVLVCLILFGYLAYKIAYPYVAPMVFDYIVDHNIDAFVKLEQSLSESLLSGESDPSGDGSSDAFPDSETTPSSGGTDQPIASSDPSGDETVTPSQAPSDSSSGEKPDEAGGQQGNQGTAGSSAPVDTSQSGQTQKPNTDIQAVKTTMGVFSGEHLARALKNMSPADKTRIISLCQNAVSTSDILKVSKMLMQDGLTKEQQKYIENYLRDNLSVPHKREILEILQQY